MQKWIERCKAVTTRRVLAAALAVATVGSVATLNFTKSAKAAVAAPALRSQAAPAVLTPWYLRRPDAVPPGPAKRVTPA